MTQKAKVSLNAKIVPSKTNPNVGGLSISVRINGETSRVVATGIKVKIGTLDTKTKTIKNDPSNTRILRKYEVDMRALYATAFESDKPLTPNELINAMLGQTTAKDKIPTLLEAYQKHIDETVKPRVESGELDKKTPLMYERYRDHVLSFIKHEYKADDLPLEAVKPVFSSQYYLYLTTHVKQNINYASKQIAQLKTVLNWCVQYRWTPSNSIANFKGKRFTPVPQYLTEDELKTLEALHLTDDTLQLVLDGFLIQCYTGFRYSDLRRFSYDWIKTDKKGRPYIEYTQQKTKITAIVPISKPVERLLEKYRGHGRKKENEALAVLTNQKMNVHLKSIQQIAKIETSLVTHLGRKTFANRTRNANVELSTVSETLGHATESMTVQHYTRNSEPETVIDNMKNALDKWT